MSAAQYKKEKKIIEEKVQKIRQVVPTTSTNEIILALHNYDLDVERTIQAFLEEGAVGALGDWDTSAKSKKSKKKNTPTVAKANSTASSTVDSTTGTLKQNGKSTSSSSNSNNGFTNGYTNGVTATAISASSSSNIKPKQAPKNQPSSTATTKLDNLDRIGTSGKSKDAASSIAQCFKELRQTLNEREKQLSTMAREGGSYFAYDNAKLINAIANFGEIVSMNGASIQTPILHSAPSQSNEIKHATSHSSLVSSVGEDSGLGQISPVANEKNVAKVEGSGGFTMQSNAMSTDELAEIQRQFNEQLKAQGIDPSVLQGTCGVPLPPRRRQPQQNDKNKKPNGGHKKNTKPSIELSILN